MSLDFKKAFDYMSHEYLRHMMDRRNLGDLFSGTGDIRRTWC